MEKRSDSSKTGKTKKPVTLLTPVHPGEILSKEFMQPIGLIAYAVGLAFHTIDGIVNGDISITVDIARRLARYF